jgi:hypothetical protein
VLSLPSLGEIKPLLDPYFVPVVERSLPPSAAQIDRDACTAAASSDLAGPASLHSVPDLETRRRRCARAFLVI